MGTEMGFDLADICITLETADAKCFEAAFLSVGKAYASACRALACVERYEDCTGCPCRSGCKWDTVFGQQFNHQLISTKKRFQKPALPFAFSVHQDVSQIPKVNGLELRLVVIGRGITALDMLLKGFVALLKQEATPLPETSIKAIYSRDFQGGKHYLQPEWSLIEPGQFEYALISSYWITDVWPGDTDTVSVTFCSPLQLAADGRPVRQFNFGLFARTVMRRVSSLAYYYGDYEFDVDYRQLSARLDDVICVGGQFDYLSADRTSRYTGMTGSGVFNGQLAGILPFLRLGSYLNVGKLCSFGMGHYLIDSESSNQV